MSNGPLDELHFHQISKIAFSSRREATFCEKPFKTLCKFSFFISGPPRDRCWDGAHAGLLRRPFGRPFGSGLETRIQRKSTKTYNVKSNAPNHGHSIQCNWIKICNLQPNAIHIWCNPCNIHSTQTIQSLKARTANVKYNVFQWMQSNPIVPPYPLPR